MMRISSVPAFCILAAGCAAYPTARVLTSNPPRAVDVAVLEAQTPLAPSDNIRPTELERGEHSSVALVQIRDREQPHIHSRYDLTVTLVAGAGTLWLNGTALPMRSSDVAYIPRGTPHYFVNDGPVPAAALVSFSPPFSGPDQQPAP
jgi:mannose-6-phosphate isomerase-like protein (cupin superfamily)